MTDEAQTPEQPVEAPQEAAQQPVAQPVTVDGTNRPHSAAGLEGHFVKVIRGEHAGRVGVFLQTLERDLKGLPTRILFRSHDEFNELKDVAYRDVEHHPQVRR